MLTSGHDEMRISVMLSRGPTILNFGRASQRSNGFEVWTYFPEVLDMLPKGALNLKFGCAS